MRSLAIVPRHLAAVTIWLGIAAGSLPACTTATGGGSSATPCPVTGPCPGNLVCLNGFCVVVTADVSFAGDLGPDVASPADTTPGVDVPTVADVPSTIKDVPAPQDLANAELPSAQDVGQKPDLPATGPMTIAQIQSGGASITCANTAGTTTSFAGVQLEPAVVTGPSFTVGTTTKSQVFFVSSASGTLDGTNNGLQVLVYGGNVTVAPGDVVSIKGDVKEFFCMTEIATSFTDIVVTGKVTPPLPTSVQIGMLGQASAEPYEDEYIRIDDVYIVSPNTTGTDGKTHGEFSIGASPGNAILLVGPGAATTFTSKDPTSGQIVTSFKSGQHFSSITGDLTFSFGEWLLKPRSDADLVP